MRKSLRVLNVEDSERDSALLLRHLTKAGYEVVAERVQTAAAMKSALKESTWDIVLCDYVMPKFDALGALAALRASGIDIPFIIISGTVGEEIAVQAMLTGAHDYLPKGNLTRLIPAVERELKEASNRQQLRWEGEERRLTEGRYRTLFEYAPDGIIISGPDDYYLDANTSVCQMLGYDHTELKGMHATDIVIRSEGRELDSEFALVQSSPDYNREWHFKRKDGSVFPAEVIATIMPDGNLLAMIRDISDRKLAEKALSASEREKGESLALINTVLSRAPIGFAFHDRELRYVRINETLAAINGLTVEQHLDRTIAEILPAMASLLDPIMRRVISTGRPVVDFELKGETPAEPGKEKHWLVSFYPVRMEAGEILGIGVLVTEVTQRREAENALRESEERYRDLVENAIDVIYTLDLEGNYTSMNRAGELLSGFPRESSLTRNIADSIIPEYREKAMQMIKAQIDGHDISAFEIEIMSKEGRRVALEVNTRAIKEKGITVGVQGIARDITERKEKQAELHRQRVELRALFDYIPAMICFKDTHNGIVRANKQLAATAGLSVDDIEGHSTEDVFPEFAEKYFADDLEVINSGLPKLGIVETYQDKDGSEVTIHTDKVPMFDLKGQVNGVLVMAADISARVRDEEKLRESEERFSGAFELAPIGVALVLPKGRFLKVNRALCELTGYTESELLELSFQEITHPDDVKQDVMNSRRLLKGKISHYQMEKRYIHKLGNIVFVSINVSLVRDGSSQPLYFIAQIQDITEKTRVENERRIIGEIAQGAVTSSTLHKFLDLVHRSVSQILYAENCIVMLVDPATNLFHYEFWVDKYDPQPLPRPVGKGFGAYVLRTGNPLLLTIEMKQEMVDRGDAELSGTPANSWIGVPLRTATQTIGVMVVQHYETENVYDQHDLDFLVSVSDQIALVIERQRAEDLLRESDEKFRQLADNIDDSFWIRSPDLKKIYYISPAFEKIWGHPLESVYAKPDQWLNFILPEDREYVREAYKRLMGPAPTIDIEYRIVRSDDEIRWVRTRGFQVLDSDSNLIRLAGIVSDVTDRKAVEEELKASDEKFHQLADNITDAFWIRSPDMNKIYYISPAYERIWGRTLKSDYANPLEWYEFIVPVDRQRVKKIYAALMDDTPNIEIEYRILRPDGEMRWVRARGFQVRDSAGDLIRLAGIVTDITESKHAIEALGESENRYRSVVETAPDVIVTIDDSSRICFINPAAERIFGYSNDEMKGASLTMLMPEYLRHLHDAGFKRYQQTGEKHVSWEYVELIGLHKNGLEIPITISFSEYVQNDQRYFTGIIRDITDRKQAMEALRESEERNRELIENAIDIIYTHDLAGNYTSINKAAERITGYTSEEALTMQISHTIAPEYLAKARQMIVEKLAGNDIPAYEIDLIGKDNQRVSLEVNTRIIYEKGTAIGVQGIARDITERKLKDSLLFDSQEQLALAAESVRLGIWDWDIVENKIEWDSRMYELYGTSAEDFGGAYEAWEMGLHPDDRQISNDNIKAALADERPFNTEFRVVWPNGEIRNIEARAVVKRDGSGSPVRMIGVNWDITDRKNLEDQYRQSQKMEAVGVLAGGIAHDFNNLLTAINGFSDLTLRRMETDNPFRRNIQEVKNAGTRAAELTGQLLAFSRKQIFNASVINVNLLISNIESMLRRIIRESVELRVVLESSLGNIKADPGQIEQVIMNLAINARDAMPDGGILMIETNNIYLDEEYASQHIMVAHGAFIKITVTDTGTGMDATTRSHIFEPFFTTKEVGKGTGLGLSTVYGIVKQSGGAIMVYSEPGHGTTFKVYLPCVDDPVEKPRWIGESENHYSGTETILVVEDEEAVRSFVVEVFETGGYSVLSASNGPDALELCRNYTAPIHLLVTDVIMPKMGGGELKKCVVKILPDIKVLFMSGYTDGSIADRGVYETDIAFIEKPFTPEALMRKVRTVLDQ